MNRLKGKRTYAAVAAAVVYLLGGKYGLWAIDEEVVALAGFVVVGFLRAATGTPKGRRGFEEDTSTNQHL